MPRGSKNGLSVRFQADARAVLWLRATRIERQRRTLKFSDVTLAQPGWCRDRAGRDGAFNRLLTAAAAGAEAERPHPGPSDQRGRPPEGVSVSERKLRSHRLIAQARAAGALRTHAVKRQVHAAHELALERQCLRVAQRVLVDDACAHPIGPPEPEMHAQGVRLRQKVLPSEVEAHAGLQPKIEQHRGKQSNLTALAEGEERDDLLRPLIALS